MLSEHQETIWAKALWVERLELLALARQPAHRIPAAIAEKWQREYFRHRLGEAVARLGAGSEPLAEVLEEILLLAT